MVLCNSSFLKALNVRLQDYSIWRWRMRVSRTHCLLIATDFTSKTRSWSPHYLFSNRLFRIIPKQNELGLVGTSFFWEHMVECLRLSRLFKKKFDNKYCKMISDKIKATRILNFPNYRVTKKLNNICLKFVLDSLLPER